MASCKTAKTAASKNMTPLMKRLFLKEKQGKDLPKPGKKTKLDINKLADGELDTEDATDAWPKCQAMVNLLDKMHSTCVGDQANIKGLKYKADKKLVQEPGT